MSVKMRIEVEQKIVRAFVQAALKAGYRLSVSLENGYDIDTMRENNALGSTDEDRIMEEAFTGDDCVIFVHEAEGELVEDESICCVGWVKPIYGNSGYDVLSNWTSDLEDLGLLTEALELADKYDYDSK